MWVLRCSSRPHKTYMTCHKSTYQGVVTRSASWRLRVAVAARAACLGFAFKLRHELTALTSSGSRALSLRRTSRRGLRDLVLDVGTNDFKAQRYTFTYALGNERRLCTSQCIAGHGLESATHGGQWCDLFKMSRARVCVGTAGLVIELWDSVIRGGTGIQHGILLHPWLLQW